MNHVYVDVDLTSDDTINITVNTTGTQPAQPSLKIAEVDTSADTKTEWNREPYNHGSYATVSDVPRLAEGNFVWVQDEGRYYYEDGN